MKRSITLVTLILLVLTGWAQVRMPFMRIQDIGKDEKPVKISRVKIDVEVVGTLAVTTVDMTFHNPNSRVLEGELEFPLADGQNISRFALDINGKMREGVVVEKAKGQEVFESIVRQGVDPGLLEKTEGNNFRTRVYPLFANGTRRVIIAYEQELVPDAGKYYVFLPVQYGDVLDKFEVNLVAHTNDQKPQVEKTPWSNFSFSRAGEAYIANYSAENYKPSGQVTFSVPVKKEIQLYIENGEIDNKTVFYTQILPDVNQTEKKLPSDIALFWDASSSMQERNFDMESQLLDQYFRKIGNLTVSLYTFNCKESKPRKFSIRNGNWNELKNALQNTIYDGATQLGMLNLSAVKADEILFFSDGMSNFGQIAPVVGNTPIITINSMLTADYSMLRYLSVNSGGVFINLMQQSVPEAMKQLSSESLRLIAVDYDKEQIKDLTTSGSTINPTRGLSIAGKLVRNAATLTLKFGKGNKVTTTEKVTINASDAADYGNMVERLWAAKRIEELDMLYDENKREIERLGKKYNIVTRNTSLIVLEEVWDYVQHDITPPEELKEEFYKLRSRKVKDADDDRIRSIDEAAKLWKQRKEWWSPKPVETLYTVHGSVKGEKGESLIASVQIDGRPETAVQTSHDGHFLIKARKGDYLVFSAFSHVSQRKIVKGDEQMTVVLKRTVKENTEQPVNTVGTGTHTVKGVVREAFDMEPLVGVNIMIKNKAGLGAVTNLDGEFSIKADQGDILEIRYIGFDSVEREVDVNEPMQIFLEASSQHLDEVVVAGYASESRQSMTGAVSTVNVNDLNAPSGNVANALAGRVPGVSVNETATTVTETTAAIFLKGWEADAPYMKELKMKSDKELYSAYLAIRKDYQTAPSFYLDVATLFQERGMKEEAFLILSNLAEMKLDNYRILRVLAHRLQQLGYVDYAIRIFEKVKELRPEEAQSFRDLGLAYADNKEYQKAINELNEIITRRWDSRFPEIEIFAVEEINNIVAKAPKGLDLSNVDERLLFNMPVDVRIVLNWDTDNSDMDLWVTDPSDEKCYYKNKLTKARGMITSDFTDGYGPEAFLIKKAPKGKYIIEADYYGTSEQTLVGPTTIYLDVYTYYGTPKETKKTIMLRLEENEGEVEIGEIEF